MLDDLEHAKRNLKGFRRGLSIYEDQTLRKQLTEETAAPVLSNPALSDKLQQVIFSDANLGHGPKQSIIQNYAKDYDEEGFEGEHFEEDIESSPDRVTDDELLREEYFEIIQESGDGDGKFRRVEDVTFLRECWALEKFAYLSSA